MLYEWVELVCVEELLLGDGGAISISQLDAMASRGMDASRLCLTFIL